MKTCKSEADAYLIEHFGMTAEAIRRVMKNHKREVNKEAREVIENLDFYKNPLDYVDADQLPEGWDEKYDEADGYPELYNYAKDLFGNDGAKVFKDLISWGTPYGGMGSACEALQLIRNEEPDEEGHPTDCPWG